jgi:hypothetical protein
MTGACPRVAGQNPERMAQVREWAAHTDMVRADMVRAALGEVRLALRGSRSHYRRDRAKYGADAGGYLGHDSSRSDRDKAGH